MRARLPIPLPEVGVPATCGPRREARPAHGVVAEVGSGPATSGPGRLRTGAGEAGPRHERAPRPATASASSQPIRRKDDDHPQPQPPEEDERGRDPDGTIRPPLPGREAGEAQSRPGPYRPGGCPSRRATRWRSARARRPARRSRRPRGSGPIDRSARAGTGDRARAPSRSRAGSGARRRWKRPRSGR